MTLQQGVKFHDGTDFNADAVKYNLDLIRSGNLPDLKNVTSVDVVDNYTVRINFSEYHSNFFTLLARSAGRMVSPTALKAYPKEQLHTNPVGTGPFKFVSYQQDVSLVYTKFKDYWQKGKPYLDGVQYDYVADRTVGLMAFKSGQDQFDSFLDPRDASGLSNLSDYSVFTIPAVTVGAIESSANSNSPFHDLRVRQAVNCAVPTDQLPPLVGFGAQAGAQLFPPGSAGNNPSITPLAYDPAKARQLLADAGYPNGFSTTIYVYSNIEMDAWTAILGYLKAVGINATIDSRTMAAWMDMIFTKGWDGMSCAYITCSPGLSVLDNLTNSLSIGGASSPTSKSFLYPDAYTTAFKAAPVELDPAKLQADIQALNKMAITDYSMFQPFYVYYLVSAKNNKLHDDLIYEVTSYLWTPETAWLSK